MSVKMANMLIAKPHKNISEWNFQFDIGFEAGMARSFSIVCCGEQSHRGVMECGSER